MSERELTGLVVRVSFMYVYALALLNLSGKRTYGELSPVDFVTTLIMGDLFDDVVFNEVPLAEGLVAQFSVTFAHLAVNTCAFVNPAFGRLVNATPTIIIDRGKFIHKALRKEKLRTETVESILRENEIEDRAEVERGMLEPDGHVSVVKHVDARAAQKQDSASLHR